METELANVPNTTGAPGRQSWANAMPTLASARIWVSVPAAVTGDMAPCQNEGRDDGRLPGAGIDLQRAEHGVESNTMGELALMSEIVTQFWSTNSSPKTSLAILQPCLRRARDG
jgi:hypothetical protein